ncbi:hypothetical protein [Okeania sp. SIO1I7]|uniref:hypothetical protein n=1 Tax=Okeania sp. SIO1I7 TaxID=2607772 RepID=UPI0013F8A72C|nr:hypothetical protein [Okeania sp. SIO1I7]NET29526.1 hypothetical protein [Okeania sp. SIO1I7]
MPEISGSWLDLGIVFPGNEWKIFPQDIGEATIFRVEYSTDWEAWEELAGYQSYGILRVYYDSWVEPSFRVYPQKNILVFSYTPILQDIPKKIGVRRILKYRPRPYRKYNLKDFSYSSTILNWSLRLFALQKT